MRRAPERTHLVGLAAALLAALAVAALLLARRAQPEHVAGETPPGAPSGPAGPGTVELSNAGASPVARGADAQATAANPGREALPEARAARAPWSQGRIRGAVLGGEEGTTPVAGASVRATCEHQRTVLATTLAAGEFVLESLPAGLWTVTAQDAAGATGTAQALVGEDSPEAVVVLVITRKLDLLVLLVDEAGQPVTAAGLGVEPSVLSRLRPALGRPRVAPGARFDPAEGSPRHTCRDVSADGQRNTWTVEGSVRQGECLHAVFGDTVVASRPLSAEMTRAELVVRARDLEAALAPLQVEVISQDDGRALTEGAVLVAFGGGPAQVRALGAGGLARFDRCPAGDLQVAVESPGFVRETVQTSVPRAGPLRVELQRARTIEGRVVAVRSVQGLSLTLWRIEDPGAPLGHAATYVAIDRDQRFARGGLRPGTYAIGTLTGWTGDGAPRGADVLAGKVPGAAWVDLRAADATGIVVTIPTLPNRPARDD